MFKAYRKKQLTELRPYVPNESILGISISELDIKQGSPKLGDMIARNPHDPHDQWLVSAAYFDNNYILAEEA